MTSSRSSARESRFFGDRSIQAGAVVVGANVDAFPYGFVPHLKATEEDWAVSGGIRGEADLSCSPDRICRPIPGIGRGESCPTGAQPRSLRYEQT